MTPNASGHIPPGAAPCDAPTGAESMNRTARLEGPFAADHPHLPDRTAGAIGLGSKTRATARVALGL
ncbi:hypothetical protein GCM10011404_14330 [Sphingomonas prati]|nr:hypothetical protein GCM10011404_14330 [Sphingomonas prati]